MTDNCLSLIFTGDVMIGRSFNELIPKIIKQIEQISKPISKEVMQGSN